jgi:thiol-disulfide isomerase/thioredoxin
MKKIFALFIAFYVFLRQWQKTSFSEAALSETILTTDGSQLAFQDVLKAWRENFSNWNLGSWCGDCIKAMPK